MNIWGFHENILGTPNLYGESKMKAFLDDKKKMPAKYLKEQNLGNWDNQETSSKIFLLLNPVSSMLMELTLERIWSKREDAIASFSFLDSWTGSPVTIQLVLLLPLITTEEHFKERSIFREIFGQRSPFRYVYLQACLWGQWKDHLLEPGLLTVTWKAIQKLLLPITIDSSNIKLLWFHRTKTSSMMIIPPKDQIM